MIGAGTPESVGVGEEGEANFVDVEVADKEGQHGLDSLTYFAIKSRLHFVYENIVTFSIMLLIL